MAKKLWVENNVMSTAVVYQDIEPTSADGFTDRTSNIEYWDIYGLRVLQYKQVRDIIAPLFYTIVGQDFSGWAASSSIVKLIGAKWILAPYAVRLSVVTDDVDIDNYATLVEETKGVYRKNLIGRHRIVEEMDYFVAIKYYRKELISKNDVDDLISSTKTIIDAFKSTNTPDFKYWLLNTVGTAYENDGFAQKSYFSTEIRDGLISIYYGDY